MNGCTQAAIATGALLALFVLVYMIVPTEQTLDAKFPNVVILRGLGTEAIDPISFDNNTLPTLEASEASKLGGLFQFDPMFYHKTLDRFIPWEERHTVTAFECTLFCSPLNRSSRDVRLALIHTSPAEKKHLWYLIELRDDDVNSPIIYARSKFRKEITYRSPWMTVTPGGQIKPRDLKDVHIVTAWDAFRFDTPLKWGVTVTLVASTVVFFKMRASDD
mmetsp:Transcript_134947/g.234621  ORF Transcript_134947/g.234621 Transcript_134947/m.234621 type:complete len:219 (+) Transcript_134947:228-884(+)